MRFFTKLVCVIAVNVMVLAILCEIGGNLYFLKQTGQFFYSAKRPGLDSSVDTNPFMTGEFHAVFHPYFGFTYKPSVDATKRHVYVNNHGFLFGPTYVQQHPGCCDYPSVRSDSDEVIVGVFGGSVAGALAYWMQEHATFVDALRLIPRFAGKRIRILPFALGGHKQPQQLMILTYYLSLGQPFDVIVNVDGFNELTEGVGLLRSGIDVGYPDTYLWMRLVTFIEHQAQSAGNPENLLANYHLLVSRRWARHAANCATAACYSLAKLVQAWHGYNATGFAPSAESAAASPSFFQVDSAALDTRGMFDELGVPTSATVYDIIARYWINASDLMQRLARSQNILYLHALQPNAFFRRSTPYIARDPEAMEVAQRIVSAGYPAFLAAVPRLRELGVNFLDASAILDGEPITIYADDAGHYTPRGYDLLALAIARALAAPDIR